MLEAIHICQQLFLIQYPQFLPWSLTSMLTDDSICFNELITLIIEAYVVARLVIHQFDKDSSSIAYPFQSRKAAVYGSNP